MIRQWAESLQLDHQVAQQDTKQKHFTSVFLPNIIDYNIPHFNMECSHQVFLVTAVEQ